MTKQILMALVASVVVAIAVAPIAGANPVGAQYDKPSTTKSVSTPAPTVKGESTSETVPAATPTQVVKVSTGETLPFTGLDLGLFLVIGGVAVASGLGLRRVAARRSLDR